MLQACIRPGPGEAFGGYASSHEVLALALEAPIGGRVINLSTRLPQSAVIEVAAVVVAFAVSISAAFVLYRLVKPSRIGHGEKSRATHQEIRLLDAHSTSPPEHSRNAAP